MQVMCRCCSRSWGSAVAILCPSYCLCCSAHMPYCQNIITAIHILLQPATQLQHGSTQQYFATLDPPARIARPWQHTPACAGLSCDSSTSCSSTLSSGSDSAAPCTALSISLSIYSQSVKRDTGLRLVQSCSLPAKCITKLELGGPEFTPGSQIKACTGYLRMWTLRGQYCSLEHHQRSRACLRDLRECITSCAGCHSLGRH